jgi:hypothetical protein
MMSFFLKGLLEMWCPCGTKFGKSIAAASSQAGKAWITPNSLYRWVAPVYSQAKIGQNYAKKILPPNAKPINSGVLSLNLPNGTTMEYRSGKTPEDLEGEGVFGGYCLDEASKMKEQVYISAKTTVSMTRAPIVVFSTPRGKNWFFKKCMEAKDHMEWSIKKGIPPTKLYIPAPTALNPFIPPESIADAKKNMPDRLFRQYYLAEFVDDGEVMVGFRECLYQDDPLDLSGDTQFWVKPDSEKAEIVIACDWAKHQDYTVMGAFECGEGVKPRLIGFSRFNGLRYTEQVRKLVMFSRMFAKTRIVYHDKTGVGEAIDDLLSQTGLNFHGVVFTNSSKSAMVNNLITAWETKSLDIPYWEEMIGELEAFEVQTSDTGLMRYNAPSGLHDDIVCMLMLGWAAVSEYSAEFRIRFLEDLPKDKSIVSLDSYYQDILEDDD